MQNDKTKTLFNEVKAEINEAAERAFKNNVREKITAIAAVQRQISDLATKLAALKVELKSLEYTPLDDSAFE